LKEGDAFKNKYRLIIKTLPVVNLGRELIPFLKDNKPY
jgi:hypothetical protein